MLWWCADEMIRKGLSQQGGRADCNCETDFPLISRHLTWLVAESERASVSHAALSLDDTTDSAWGLDSGI